MVTSCALPPHVWQGAKVGSVVRMARSSSGRHVQSRPQPHAPLHAMFRSVQSRLLSSGLRQSRLQSAGKQAAETTTPTVPATSSTEPPLPVSRRNHLFALRGDDMTACNYWVDGKPCNAANTRPYTPGWRCLLHTPAALAGRAEPPSRPLRKTT
jgi:hypothetical protein